jgi:hypothetical protein
LAQRSSRKRRKQRRRGAEGAAGAETTGAGDAASEQSGAAMARGYARSRVKDDAARAALKPLAPGERPTAVTVGAIVAGVMAVANVVALAFGYDADRVNETVSTIFGSVLMAVVAIGMWRARYWAVLGMQTVLAIAIVLGSLALLTAANIAAVLFAGSIVAAAGTLFWFLVKAMARIQMPARPGADRPR